MCRGGDNAYLRAASVQACGCDCSQDSRQQLQMAGKLPLTWQDELIVLTSCLLYAVSLLMLKLDA